MKTTSQRIKSVSKEEMALFLAKDGADDALEPLVDSLLANGLTQKDVFDAVAASAERILRVSLTDQGLPVTVKGGVQLRSTTVQAEARRVAKKLFERLTVTNPDAVPSVRNRRWLPAAVAAAKFV
jgi:hypothetical protein